MIIILIKPVTFTVTGIITTYNTEIKTVQLSSIKQSTKVLNNNQVKSEMTIMIVMERCGRNICERF
jgi:hypothetical protein